jgi:hypothetical protein
VRAVGPSPDLDTHLAADTPSDPRSALDPERLKGALYGTILVTSLVAGLGEDEDLSAWDIAFWVVLTNVVFWLAHVYAGLVAEHLRRRRPPRPRDLAHEMAVQWPMVQAVTLPTVALLLAAAGVWSRSVGIHVGVALGVVALFGWGLVVGRLSGLTWLGVLATALVNTAFGLVIVVLEVLID